MGEGETGGALKREAGVSLQCRKLERTPEKSAGTGGQALKVPEDDKNRAERPGPLEPQGPCPGAPRHPPCLGKTSHRRLFPVALLNSAANLEGRTLRGREFTKGETQSCLWEVHILRGDKEPSVSKEPTTHKTQN